MLDLGPAQRGVDGVLYQAGGYSPRSPLHGTAVVMVRAPGGCELLTGWDSPLAPWEWVRGRLPSQDGPLHVSPAGSRTACEEQLLAFGLRYPWELDWLAGAISGHVFSCDARDEIFTAAMCLHRRGGTVDARTLADEVARRYEQAPAWAREQAGGAQVPWTARYLRRLAVTEVTPAAAALAVAGLVPGYPVADDSCPACLVRPAVQPQAVMVLAPAQGPRSGPAPRM
jgi:hypothetical protein